MTKSTSVTYILRAYRIYIVKCNLRHALLQRFAVQFLIKFNVSRNTGVLHPFLRKAYSISRLSRSGIIISRIMLSYTEST